MSQKKETFISDANIPRMEVVHDDERRSIREAEMRLSDGTIRRVTQLAIKGAGLLGNHYHPKPEHFTVLDGNPTIITADNDNPQIVTERHLPNGGHITMAPGEAHAFRFDRPGNLISTMDGAFDPGDLIPFNIEEHKRLTVDDQTAHSSRNTQ